MKKRHQRIITTRDRGVELVQKGNSQNKIKILKVKGSKIKTNVTKFPYEFQKPVTMIMLLKRISLKVGMMTQAMHESPQNL